MAEIVVIDMLLTLIWVILLLLSHEFGHYIKAVRQGIYRGWDIFPTPHIKLKRKFSSRWDYAWGMIFSCVTLPVYFLTNIPILMFPVFILATGLGDIFIIIIWGRA